MCVACTCIRRSAVPCSEDALGVVIDLHVLSTLLRQLNDLACNMA
jgi:hypothetical protein